MPSPCSFSTAYTTAGVCAYVCVRVWERRTQVTKYTNQLKIIIVEHQSNRIVYFAFRRIICGTQTTTNINDDNNSNNNKDNDNGRKRKADAEATNYAIQTEKSKLNWKNDQKIFQRYFTLLQIITVNNWKIAKEEIITEREGGKTEDTTSMPPVWLGQETDEMPRIVLVFIDRNW